MPSQHYQALPVEEKVDDDQSNPPPPSRQWSKTRIALLLSLLLLLSTIVAIATQALTLETPAVDDLIDDEGTEWLREHLTRATGDKYLIGVGKADITGPVVEINFMGYASLSQVGTGLRQRIYSRAFIIGDVNNPDDRFVYLVMDTQSGDTAVRYGILRGLEDLGSDYAMYSQSNVAVTGTHQHSGPGAWVNYLLPQITSLGFDQQSYQAVVDGAVLSIQRAHESLVEGTLSYADANVTGANNANINRSPYAYLANPAAERALYEDDTDKTLTMLRFQRTSDGKNIGVLGWHSVHGTSMLENNTHVTGDNKGLTSYLFESAMKSDTTAADGFVAAFSQSSVGDTTPNILGAYCDDGSGEMCSFEQSTCGETNTTKGTSENCHGRGPEFQALDLGVASCYEIGRRVYSVAKSLYDSFDSVAIPVTDTSVKAYHTFQDMQYFNFTLTNGTAVQTCPAALGYSFAGGTSDGPGAFDFVQNDNTSSSSQNPLWQIVSGVISEPDAQQKACQEPKPILLNVGQLSVPYDWSPNIIDVQSLRVGQLIMIISPSEATTMTGRRWKAAVAQAAISKGVTSSPKVVLGGPANTYAHYCVTPEEYGIQRYEGASTLYGPWESYAYMYLSTSNIGYLAADSTTSPPAGPSPPDNQNNSISLITGVVYDSAPLFKSFGQVLTQPATSYAPGAVINATFQGANPRNNLRLEGTFAAVELLESGKWTQVRDDADWSLVYTWVRDDSLLGTSHVVISWESETDAAAGTYRIKYYGDSKALGGTISAFTGTSNQFTLS
ncbi:Neutral ceramidase 2 [Hyphodiscus hymeniophilus]|uniref:Neutral ceramidase n=1 Tax=Hyphodiscus hymeniophilus TaxID=353542 RepID=A0A9P6VMK3_9HELO|nr:Neutral ceramidase 2 [Hyphodiscus hymeniophilus]